MATIALWAGATAATMAKLPSPDSIKPTYELIWSENTGRAQSGTNTAKMIGDTVAEKMTYAIQWGVITAAEMLTIRQKLTRGFFYFGIGTTTTAPSSPTTYYRGEITANMIMAGDGNTYYKDVNVTVIQQ